MDAAFNLFLEQGYSNVSMTDIIRRSGGSLATAYQLFENKAGLLRAIVIERFACHDLSITEISESSEPPEQALQHIARYYLGSLLDQASVGLLRIIVAESLHDPQFGQHLKDSSPELAVSGLIKAFTHWHEQGVLDVDDPELAADSFFAMLLHRALLEALCGVPFDMTAAEIDRHVDHVVKMICCRYRPMAE